MDIRRIASRIADDLVTGIPVFDEEDDFEQLGMWQDYLGEMRGEAQDLVGFLDASLAEIDLIRRLPQGDRRPAMIGLSMLLRDDLSNNSVLIGASHVRERLNRKIQDPYYKTRGDADLDAVVFARWKELDGRFKKFRPR